MEVAYLEAIVEIMIVSSFPQAPYDSTPVRTSTRVLEFSHITTTLACDCMVAKAAGHSDIGNPQKYQVQVTI